MRYMGIDFGRKRVGVAISDESNGFALPHSVIQNDVNVVSEIEKICSTLGITDIVIGESRDYSGKENQIMDDVRGFIKKLNEGSKVKIHLEPEFLTSIEAERLQGKGNMIDASAAALILKSYLAKKDYGNNR